MSTEESKCYIHNTKSSFKEEQATARVILLKRNGYSSDFLNKALSKREKHSRSHMKCCGSTIHLGDVGNNLQHSVKYQM
jgi:hypothetical protein